MRVNFIKRLSLFFYSSLFLYSCGIPAFTILSPPEVFTANYTLPATNAVLIFRMTTSSAVAYTLYYKIYNENTQSASRVNDEQRLTDQFRTDVNNDDEIFTGDRLLNTLNFKRVFTTVNRRQETNIGTLDNFPDQYIYIYFDGEVTALQEAYVFVSSTSPSDIDPVVDFNVDATNYASTIKLARSVYYTDSSYGKQDFYKSFYEKYRLSDNDLPSVTSSSVLSINIAAVAIASSVITTETDSQAIFVGSVSNINVENKQTNATTKP